MNLQRDIHNLSTFKRDASRLVKQVQQTKQPMILTVNGKAAAVMQDTESYQALLEARDRLAAIEGIRRGLDCVARGDVQDADEMFAELYAKHGLEEE